MVIQKKNSRFWTSTNAAKLESTSYQFEKLKTPVNWEKSSAKYSKFKILTILFVFFKIGMIPKRFFFLR